MSQIKLAKAAAETKKEAKADRDSKEIKKKHDIINLKDPKARKMAKKYRDKISKDVDKLLKTQLKYS